jgi:hypothetical protein
MADLLGERRIEGHPNSNHWAGREKPVQAHLPLTALGEAQQPLMLESKPNTAIFCHPSSARLLLTQVSCTSPSGKRDHPYLFSIFHTVLPGEKIDAMFAYTIILLLAAAF